MIGEAVSVALKDAAYAVDWVKDGDTAWHTLAHSEYQAVLLDLGLPKRDGDGGAETPASGGQQGPGDRYYRP